MAPPSFRTSKTHSFINIWQALSYRKYDEVRKAGKTLKEADGNTGMDKIDAIFKDMDEAARDKLKQSIAEYKTSGCPAAKDAAKKILKDCEDREAIRLFLKEL